MEIMEIIQFINENKGTFGFLGTAFGALFTLIGGVATFLISRNSTIFKQAQELRNEQIAQNKRLSEHIKDNQKEIDELQALVDVLSDLQNRFDKYLLAHKYDQSFDIVKAKSMCEKRIVLGTTIKAKLDNNDLEDLKKLVDKDHDIGDQLLVVMNQIDLRNEAVTDYDIPQRKDTPK